MLNQKSLFLPSLVPWCLGGENSFVFEFFVRCSQSFIGALGDKNVRVLNRKFLETQTINKILIIRPKFLGDLILATGLIEVIHQNNPQAEVWFLSESGYTEDFETSPPNRGRVRP